MILNSSEFIKTLDSDKFEILNLFNYGIEKRFSKFNRINNTIQKN